MIANAVTLAILSVAGMFFVFKKLPRKIRRWIIRHGLFADVAALVLTYMLFGGTVTALIAAALAGIMTSVLIFIGQNPDDFEYLNVIGDTIKDQISRLKQAAKEFGEDYRNKKMMEAESVR